MIINKTKFKDFINFLKSPKGKKIISTAVVTFVVCLFYIWMSVGLYIFLDEEKESLFLPIFLMYLVFPILLLFFGARKMYIIYTKGYEDTMADKPNKES